MRPQSVLQLLQSVQEQTLYPDEILIIDGSTNQETEHILTENQFQHLHYFAVPHEHRGLTKQRNYGIERVGSSRDLTINEIEIVCFLDDDTVLEQNYFEEIIKTFEENSGISGVGGVATNENSWTLAEPNKKYDSRRYCQWEGFVYKEGQTWSKIPID